MPGRLCRVLLQNGPRARTPQRLVQLLPRIAEPRGSADGALRRFPWQTSAVICAAGVAGTAGGAARAEEQVQAAEPEESVGTEPEAKAVPAGGAEAVADDEALREQIVELVGEILRTHTAHGEEFRAQLSSSGGAVARRCAERTFEALTHLSDEKREILLERRTLLESKFQQQREEASADVSAEVSGLAERQFEALRQEAERALAGSVLDERELVGHRILSLSVPLSTLESLGQTGQGLQERSKASRTLSAALLSLGRALVEEQPHSSELAALRELGAADDFIRQIIEQVPEDTLARSTGPALTEPQLRRSFGRQVRDLAVAALEPPAEGLFGKVGAAVVGRLLGSLYVLPAADHDPGIPTNSPTDAAQRNLVALSRAAAFVEEGNLRSALVALEGLTGECSNGAAAWAREARDALLVQQAARAAQARARCLHAALS